MRLEKRVTGWATYGLVAFAVWVASEVIKSPIIDRAPAGLALRVAPNSPEVLRRASESQLAAGRPEDAKALAAASLERAPFNARALRVYGLAAARTGDIDQADALLTLAGNWSLRDDPAHAWLIERRLRQGSYSSAFAHADTLARRRPDQADTIFNLFLTAALSDPRALSQLSVLLERNPPWRVSFLNYSLRRDDGDAVALGLGLSLASSNAPYTDVELRAVYQNWFEERRYLAMSTLRRQLRRPDDQENLQNGQFSVPLDAALLPFGWNTPAQAGSAAVVLADDLDPGNLALRVEYDGYTSLISTDQIIMLRPGPRHLRGVFRVETSPTESRLRWKISCIETGQALAQWSVPSATGDLGWRSFESGFVVPDTNCTVQSVRLEGVPGDRRAATVVWFDNFRIEAG